MVNSEGEKKILISVLKLENFPNIFAIGEKKKGNKNQPQVYQLNSISFKNNLIHM